MKVSKNQIQNISFSQKKEGIKPQQAEPSVQDGEEKMAKSLDCLAGQVPVVKKDSFAKQKADLEERLNVLNKSTALHREYLEKDDERFGKDGIKSILDAVDTVEKINIVNEQLDILEDTENPESNNVWAGTILALIDPEFAKEVEEFKAEFPEVFEPTMDISPINNSPSEEDPLQQAHDELTSRVWSIALDESRDPVNNEDIDKLLALADTQEKIDYINSKLDEVESDEFLQKYPHWPSLLSQWLNEKFNENDAN